jgi:HK97 gp10 family phage protein
MTFSIDMSGMDSLMSQLNEFADFIKEEVAMEGVAAMAEVIYTEARLRAPISEHMHLFYGRDSVRTGVVYLFQPGSLRRAIYRKFSKERSTDTVKTYRISWNAKKAPYGHMVEFGTLGRNAHSFLGAAHYARKDAAVAACFKAMAERLQQYGGM